MPNGTAYSYGQYNQVLTEIIKALPSALDEIDPKHLLRVLSGEEEQLGKKLGQAFADLLKEFPLSYYQARDLGYKLIKDVPPLGNEGDYLLRLRLVNICPDITDAKDIL